MRTTILLAVAVLGLSAGCDKTHSDGQPAADNTKQNERDKNRAVTPFDQGNNQADLDTTQSIRKALMADESLSSDAKNIKVVTNAGVVALRGAVKDSNERTTVDSIARRYAGGNRVDSQIEIGQPEGQKNP